MKFQLSDTDHEVHIWKYRMGKSNGISGKGLKVLSDEERYKLNRFVFEENKKIYVLSHLFLREILSRYTGMPADEIQIIAGPNKKPFLKETHTQYPVHFNLSYRQDHALLAISAIPLIGVDIEKIKDIGHIYSFAESYFSPEELKKIFVYKKKEEKLSVLFTIWTMKEALIKSLNAGFTEPLVRYDLSPFLNCPVNIPDFDEPNTWHISQIDVDKNYKAAYAVRCNQVNLKVFDYDKC
jgi:4'-phosphopantetheinyl transferase